MNRFSIEPIFIRLCSFADFSGTKNNVVALTPITRR